MNLVSEKNIQILLDDKKGDQHRLEEMLMRVRMSKKLYNSDKLYIQKLLPTPEEKPVVFGEKPFVFQESRKRPVKTSKKKIIKKIIIILLLVGIAGIAIAASGFFPINDLDINASIPSFDGKYSEWIYYNLVSPLCNVLWISYFCGV